MKILVRDTTQNMLSRLWELGDMTSPRFDMTIEADSWDDVYTALSRLNLPPGVFIEEIQVWGHGQEGRPLINNKPVVLSYLANVLRGKTTKDTILWWRSCSTGQGSRGHVFAQDCVDILQVSCIFHCAVISWPNPLIQKEICGLRPGQEVWWSLSGSELPSCSVMRREPPAWCFKKE